MIKIKLTNTAFSANGETILASAVTNDVIIEHSCLNGRCGLCKAKVLSGESIATNFEFGLNDDERNNNYILTCVRTPKTDISLDLEGILGFKLEPPRILPVKIHEIEKINDEVVRVVLRFPPKVNFKFIPGQYVNIIKGDIKRSYSIASNENENLLVFYIRKYADGIMSEYFFNKASVSDLLRIEGPFGTFFLRKESKKNIVFLATGTGIAPVLSILSNKENKDILENRNIYLFHGGKFIHELILKPLFENSRLKYFPVLSKEMSVGCYSGYVQDILLAQKLDLCNTTVYACGSPNMIKESKLLLSKAGLEDNHFLSDGFFVSN